MNLAELAFAKGLHESQLREYGLRDERGAVVIPYFAADGSLVAEKRRTALRARDGSYWPAGKPLLAYGLNRLHAEHPDWLILVEGESDCWTIWKHDFPALGLPGSNTVRCLTADALESVGELFICKENDAGGTAFAAGVVRRLAEIGYRGEAKVFSPPAPHKDINDWYRADLALFLDALRPALREGTAVKSGAELVGLRPLAAVSSADVRWLWPGRIPMGAITVLDGDPGLGKSSVSLDLAARYSRGGPFPFADSHHVPCGNVLLLCGEDDPAAVIRPRLERAGADLHRFFILGGDEAAVAFPDDWDRVAAMIRSAEIGMVVIDPMMAFFSGRVDTNKDGDVRQVLRHMYHLACERNVTFLIVRHLNKATAVRSAVYRGGGSIGIIGQARSGLLVARAGNDAHRCILAVSKSNYAQAPLSLRYSFPEQGPLIAWEDETGDLADEILVRQGGDNGRRVDAAVRFLREVALADGGWHGVRAILTVAKTAGFHERLVYRARDELDVEVRGDLGRVGDREWRLPPTALAITRPPFNADNR